MFGDGYREMQGTPGLFGSILGARSGGEECGIVLHLAGCNCTQVGCKEVSLIGLFDCK